jgi:diguanylate cyclase (GGDEF)-like protein/PAS domain S-box-containing protein
MYNDMSREKELIEFIKKLITSNENRIEAAPELFELEGFEELYKSLLSIREGIGNIANGNLDFNITGKGYTIGTLKSLQASLKHLTWQTRNIAKGDFSHKVNFLGDFSEAFNSMTEKLSITIEELQEAEKEARKSKHELECAYGLLKENEKRILQIFEHSPVGIFYYTSEGKIENLNNKLAEIIGTSKEELMKYNAFDLPNLQMANCIYKSLSGETAFFEDKYRILSSGKELVIRFLCAPIISENNKIIGGIGIIEDFTERKLLEEEIIKLSITDKLTKIFNRLKLDQELEKEIQRSRRNHNSFAVIMMDIDYFKSVNDTYGHQTGDSVLQAFANILKTNIRETDIFGRWGGEEFLIISLNNSLDGGVILAEKLRKIIEHHKFEKVGHLTCSFGVSAFNTNSNFDSIIFNADEALYKAKKNGRNRVEI